MTIENLHKAIINGDYHAVESIIVNTNANPLVVYNGKNAIQLCFAVMRNQVVLQAVCNDMLAFLLFPKVDRHLIGNNLANRGDMMVLTDEGNFTIKPKETTIDDDLTMHRPIGEDDHYLSEYSLNAYREEKIRLRF